MQQQKFNLIGIPGALRLALIPDVAKDISVFIEDPVRKIVQVFEEMKESNPENTAH